MAKRSRGQELGRRKRPEAFDAAGALVDHDCSSSGCKEARELAEAYLAEMCHKSGVSPRRLPLLKPLLPRLLCQRGIWPPRNTSGREANALFLATAAACVDTGITGMRIQSTEGYAKVALTLEEARRAEGETR